MTRNGAYRGSTIYYAFVQSRGIVNDHPLYYFRHREPIKSDVRKRN